ncbi:MAG: leucine dehydrogenase [Myxococcota bacterium]|jgi:glutamate dehydrogenase/leucine dehydrogenase|nr:leucine dehydrogenase [Myxococcota bacterium]
MNLWQAHPEELISAMQKAGVRRACLTTDPKTFELKASHPVLEPLRASVAADKRDYHRHEGCFFELGRESGHLLSACVHLTRRGQAAGGVRFFTYDTVEGFVRDGLRLSRGMGHKNALAGLWWGGGKGVIARRPNVDHRDPALRRALYQDYGRFVSSLRGCYVTAEDAGTTADDMAQVFATTRYTSCIPKVLGGSGNPSELTARGVVVAMEAALDEMGLGTLEGKRIALQGLGHVSFFMIRELLERRVGRIIGADIDEHAVRKVAQTYEGAPLEVKVVQRGDDGILATEAEVLSPNAVGAILNARTIPGIKAKLVCGGANNQLEEPGEDDRRLQERGILYVPDFLANRMGIVNCANEQYGYIDNDPAILAHLDRNNSTGVYRRTQDVLHRAKSTGTTTAVEAVRLADELGQELHPIFGHRGRQIIDHLLETDWASDKGAGL